MDTKFIYDFLYQNRQYAFDVALLWLAFSSIISYYRVGFINILYKIIALIISIFISKPILFKVCDFLKITSINTTILLGFAIFLLVNMVLNQQVDVMFGRSRSMLDSLLGGAFGFGQFLLICIAANLSITLLDQKEIMTLPKWMSDSVAKEEREPPKDDVIYGTFTYGILRSITNLGVMEKISNLWHWAGPTVKSYVKTQAPSSSHEQDNNKSPILENQNSKDKD